MSTKHQGDVGVKDRHKEDMREPPRYAVIIHNDDYTPMDFVTSMLMVEFKHDHATAQRIMMDVHRKGKGIAGVFTREIAETKALRVRVTAEASGYPLEATFEPEA